MALSGSSFAPGEGPEGGDAEQRGDGQHAVGDAPPDHLIPTLDLPGEVQGRAEQGRRNGGDRPPEEHLQADRLGTLGGINSRSVILSKNECPRRRYLTGLAWGRPLDKPSK